MFLDGVGLGPASPDNPFTQPDLPLPAFARLAGGQPLSDDLEPVARTDHIVRRIDATLGVEGLPQSGTGQASLLAGVNGPALAGRHYGPFPHSKTRAALAERNVFARVRAAFLAEPMPVAFANAYPDRFFALVARRDRWTVTTRCCLDADVPIRTAADLAAGRALAADITGAGWRRFDVSAPVIAEEEAARRLLALMRAHRFTLFEYFLTDKAGHSRDPDRAAHVLRSLDRFFSTLLNGLDPAQELLLVTSDHGNLEDLGVKTHTRNPVPLLAVGRGATHFQDVDDLADVTPAIERALLAGQGGLSS